MFLYVHEHLMNILSAFIALYHLHAGQKKELDALKQEL